MVNEKYICLCIGPMYGKYVDRPFSFVMFCLSDALTFSLTVVSTKYKRKLCNNIFCCNEYWEGRVFFFFWPFSFHYKQWNDYCTCDWRAFIQETKVPEHFILTAGGRLTWFVSEPVRDKGLKRSWDLHEEMIFFL